MDIVIDWISQLHR